MLENSVSAMLHANVIICLSKSLLYVILLLHSVTLDNFSNLSLMFSLQNFFLHLIWNICCCSRKRKHSQIQESLFPVEQKKKQGEAAGPRAQVKIQTQQLSQSLPLTTLAAGRVWWSKNAKLPWSPCGTRPERLVLLLGFVQQNPVGLTHHAACTQAY